MALLRNGSTIALIPARHRGGGIHTDIAVWGRHEARNRHTALDAISSTPVGYRPPYCWQMARKNGGMGATRGIKGSGAIGSANLAAGINITADLEGFGEISNALGQLIVSAVAAMNGTGGLSASAVGSISASADLSGTGSLSAPLGAIVGALATLSGTGGVSGTLRGEGSMSADIAPATTVAAEVIAKAVLDAVVENGLTLADVQKLLLAVAAGDATGLDSNPVFKSQDGTVERITGALAGGSRTISSIDVS